MDLSRLPFLSIHFFLFPFSSSTRKLFVFCLSIVLALAIWLTNSTIFPYKWSLPVEEVGQTEVVELQISELESNYIKFPLDFDVYKQKISFSAGALSPSALPVYIFMIAQIFGWALLLAAASGIKSRWAFAFYLSFILFLFLSDQASYLSEESGQWISLGLGLAIIGLAYSFQINFFRLNISWRFLIFTFILSIFFASTYLEGSWMAWYHGNVNSFYFLLPLSLLWIIFVAKEPVNILLLLATNRREQKDRWSYSWIVISIVLYLLTAFLLFQEFMNWDFLSLRSIIRPHHLLTVSALFTVFGSQNLFRQVQRIFSNNESFSFLILAVSSLALAFFGLHFSLGDQIFNLAVNRGISILFFGIGLGQLLYLLLNFIPLLKQKVNLYYLTGSGIMIGYAAVFLVGILVLLISEGRDSWKSIRMFTHSQILLIADESRLENRSEDALAQYELATKFISTSPKAHYNKASILVSRPDSYQEAVNSYLAATDVFEFPYARINAALLLDLGGQGETGRRILESGINEPEFNAALANNLALLYWKEGVPDSAIKCFKKGLLKEEDLAALYSNLGLLYEEYGKEKVAHSFIEASIGLKQVGRASLINGLYWKLSKHELDFAEIDTSLLSDFYLGSNYLLNELKEGRLEAESVELKKLSKSEDAYEAILLDGYFSFYSDSLEYGKSRLDFVNTINPNKSAKANYLLALAYLEKGVPEMALKHFRLMGDKGNPLGYLHAAQIESLTGKQDSAFLHLSQLRGGYDTLWQACAKELGLLFNAYGQPVYAQTEWPLEAFSRNERIRVSLYADSANHYLWALENFRSMIAQDSMDITPYLEMGNIYLKYKDSLALKTYQYGLDIDPENKQLKLAMAKAYGMMGDFNKAFGFLEPSDSLSFPKDYFKLQAGYALSREDTSSALLILDRLHLDFPLDQEITTDLVKIYLAQQNSIAAEQILSEAINYNDRFPPYWYYYSRIMEAWGQESDASYAKSQYENLID